MSRSASKSTRQRWFLTAREVQELTGLSRSTIDRLESRGKFPKRVELSIQRVGWIVEEVDLWRRERVEERKRQGPPQRAECSGSAKQRLST
jgi:prophage regulatory protein